MAKDTKEPKIKVAVDYGKNPKIARFPQSPQNLAWSFALLDENGPFGWDQCHSHEKYFEILKRKKNFESMTREELKNTKSHSIETYKLSKAARDRLEELQLDDFEELFSLRINSANRFWCIAHENVMRVLWWDPNHLVYPVEKRNT
jgi:ribosomal protein L20